jgi:uncharacterized protein YihD (DUF1040 family)
MDFSEYGDVMRDPQRIDKIIALLTKMWKLLPDWRLNQLLNNVANSYGWKNNDLFYYEDCRLEEDLNNFYKYTVEQIKNSNICPLCENCEPITDPQCSRCIGV